MEINHEMNRYDFTEGIEFNGLMPATMEILGEDKLIGGSDKSVKFMGFEAKGNDQLQVIDIEAMYESEGGEEGGNEGGDQGGEQGGDQGGEQGGDQGGN